LVAGDSVQAQRSTRLIEDVDVMGNRRLSKDDILSHVKTRPGEPYRPKRVQRDLQTILSLGLFDERGTRVTTETGVRGGVVVTFEVQELPLILDVQFEGLPESVRATEIERVLHDEHINVVKNAVDNPSQIRRALRAIQSYLASRDWPGAKVTVQQENVTSMSVNLTFVISLSKESILDD
jgi:outer membrane protein assembly factor BamA